MSAYAGQYRNAMTSKELNYMTDHVKNESLLAQLCARAARESGSRTLSEVLIREAEEHLQHLGDLTGMLQKYAAH